MHLNALNTIDYSTLSDEEVDSMYADAVANNDNAAKVAAGIEIVHRLATPGAFFSQLNPFAETNFPKYRSLLVSATKGMVEAPEAGTSVRQSASELEQRGIAAAKSIGSGAVVIAVSAALIAAFIFFRKK